MRIDGLLVGNEVRLDFIREAIEREIKLREKPINQSRLPNLQTIESEYA